MRPDDLDLVRMVLDRQLLDADYVECGKVDDVAMELEDGKLRAVAILTGPGQAVMHLPGWVQRIALRFLGRRVTRLPWTELFLVEGRLKLRSKADALGLNEAERRPSAWLARWPGGR